MATGSDGPPNTRVGMCSLTHACVQDQGGATSSSYHPPFDGLLAHQAQGRRPDEESPVRLLRSLMSRSESDLARLSKVKVSLPFGLGEAEWTPENTERDAAWRLYVELVTRVAIQDIPENHGVMREALTSLNSLFGTTRAILKEAGPRVGAKTPSVGGLAIRVLNRGLRPFLTKWHPMLQAWEAQRPADRSVAEHESSWTDGRTFRNELSTLRQELSKYAYALGIAAGVEE